MLYETHKSGAYHVHALVDMGAIYDDYGVSIPHCDEKRGTIRFEKMHPFAVWLKEKATDAKMGWVCHATRIHEGKSGQDNARLAVGYITKYVTKGASELVMPPRWRRIGTSRDIGSPKTKSKKEFSWHVRHSIHGRDTDKIPHYLISENRELDASDFGDTGLYPPPDENA